jgi:hypothetical protein
MSYIACANKNTGSKISTCISNQSNTNANRFKDLLDDSPGTGTSGYSFNSDEYDNIDTINTFLDDQQQDIIEINAKINLSDTGTIGSFISTIDSSISTLHDNLGQYSDYTLGSGKDYSNKNASIAYNISNNLDEIQSLKRELSDFNIPVDKNDSTVLLGDETALYNQKYIITISMIIGCIILISMFVYLFNKPKHI